MGYWRMQLHPDNANLATRLAIESLAAGYIGLDFARDPGDLTLVLRRGDMPEHKDYWDFAHKMEIGDHVLIIVHDYPFALTTIKGEYNYIKERAPEIHVWFRHFRQVDKDRLYYYADYKKDPHLWDKTEMPRAIQSLHSSRDTLKLIKKWLESL